MHKLRTENDAYQCSCGLVFPILEGASDAELSIISRAAYAHVSSATLESARRICDAEQIVSTAQDGAESRVPDGVRRRAEGAGFQILSWDADQTAMIRRDGVGFLGTHGEVAAYLQAWEQCGVFLAADRERVARERGPAVGRSVLVVDSVKVIADYAQISVTVHCPFRGDRIAVPDEIAPHFEIEDVRVGNRSMFPRAQSLPATCFATRLDQQARLGLVQAAAVVDSRLPVRIDLAEAAQAEFGRALLMDACWTGTDVTLVVRALQPARFTAFILGSATTYLPWER